MRWVEIEAYLREKNLLDRVRYWKKTIEAAKNFSGTSPPSVFIGNFQYPHVFLGILSPPVQDSNANILDSPEQWYQQKASIDQVLTFRSEMIYSRFKSDVRAPRGKLIDVLQELAMSKRPTDLEIELRKSPKFRFALDNRSTPIGNPAPIFQAHLIDTPTVERRVDYILSDVDLHAQNAVFRLYDFNLPVSRIQKMFSAGLLGLGYKKWH